MATNVPYLGLGKQCTELRDYLRDEFPEAKADLATAFLERLRSFARKGGELAAVMIDPRCTQIAAFTLALASWKRLGGLEPLPKLNLACSGLAIGLGKAEFLKLAERMAAKRGWKPTVDLLGHGATPIESAAIKREREGLTRLYDMFERAPYLGSLIDPHGAGGDLFAAGYAGLAELLVEVLEAGEASAELRELAVTAQGLAKAADVLSRHYSICRPAQHTMKQEAWI